MLGRPSIVPFSCMIGSLLTSSCAAIFCPFFFFYFSDDVGRAAADSFRLQVRFTNYLTIRTAAGPSPWWWPLRIGLYSVFLQIVNGRLPTRQSDLFLFSIHYIFNSRKNNTSHHHHVSLLVNHQKQPYDESSLFL